MIAEERRLADKRLADQLAHNDAQLAEERAAGDEQLREQLAHSDAQLAQQQAAADKRLQDQLAHAEAQLKDERQAAQGQEQCAEAYAVSVTTASFDADVFDPYISTEPGEEIACTGAIVVNRGRNAITRLQAWLCTSGNSTTSYGKTAHFTSWWRLPEPLRADVTGEGQDIWLDTLTPSDLGMRYIGSAQVIGNVRGSYPIIHWRDRWGTYWEHKRGVVRQITEGEQPTRDSRRFSYLRARGMTAATAETAAAMPEIVVIPSRGEAHRERLISRHFRG